MGGGGGGGGLSKIGTALAVIFLISLVVLFAELYYFIWRRRVFRPRTNTGGGGDNITQRSSATALTSSLASSKELLYFFCLRSNSRLDRNSTTPDNPTADLDSKQRSDIEVIEMDVLKIHGVFRPPRFLFTIKEEEAEDLDSPAEQKEGKKAHVQEVPAAAAVAVEIDDATPFATPCASPIYFTPAASPAHEAVDARSTVRGTKAGSIPINPYAYNVV